MRHMVKYGRDLCRRLGVSAVLYLCLLRSLILALQKLDDPRMYVGRDLITALSQRRFDFKALKKIGPAFGQCRICVLTCQGFN